MVDYREMCIPKDFLKEEVKEEYFISEKNKKIMAIELDLVKKMLEVCKKYDIKVFAYAGTLLGAVRHKGFIPWDDDMDFCILQKDLEKLESIASKEFTEPYFFQTAKTDRKYFCGYARLRNSETTGKICWHKSNEYNNGIYIDIYVLNGLTGNERALKVQVFERKIVQKIINIYYSDIERTGGTKILAGMLRPLLKTCIPYDKMVDLYRKIVSRYDKKADKLTLITHDWNELRKSWCYRSNLEKQIFLPFEYIKVPVPENYDEVLTNLYGNYMELPAMDKRGVWHKGAIFFEPDIPYKEYTEFLYEEL